jgi:hypothetical protein
MGSDPARSPSCLRPGVRKANNPAPAKTHQNATPPRELHPCWGKEELMTEVLFSPKVKPEHLARNPLG